MTPHCTIFKRLALTKEKKMCQQKKTTLHIQATHIQFNSSTSTYVHICTITPSLPSSIQHPSHTSSTRIESNMFSKRQSLMNSISQGIGHYTFEAPNILIMWIYLSSAPRLHPSCSLMWHNV